MVKNLTAEEFKANVFDYTTNTEWNFVGEKPAIIDFYADWCQPCKMVAPILEEISEEYPEVDVYKVNTEIENELASVFQIQSIPSILFIPVDDQPQMAMGAIPKNGFEESIENVFGIKKSA